MRAMFLCVLGIASQVFLFAVCLFTQTGDVRIVAIYPASGPEGSRVEISGVNFRDISMVRFGKIAATFKLLSDEKIVALVPRWASTQYVEVVMREGIARSSAPFVVANDPRVPDDVGWKAGYVNPRPPPWEFHSVLLWGIAIADARVPNHDVAKIDVAWTRLTCRVDGRDIVLNDDQGKLRGGLYDRHPWFGRGTPRKPMLPALDRANQVVLPVGDDPNLIWHFWSASPRSALPAGKLDGCTAQARVRISPGALLQIGIDYWRSTTALWAGPDVNNHEAGVSDWYFPSPEWQEATFSNIGGPKF